MDRALAEDCLLMFNAWMAQLRNGERVPAWARNQEFQNGLESRCERLRAYLSEEPPDQPAPPNDAIHLIVSGTVDAGRDGLRHLRKWLAGANEVVICDPYFLQFRPTSLFPDLRSYADGLAGLFPATVKSIDLYTNSYAKVVRPTVLRALKAGRSVRHFSSPDLHDRFVIKDRVDGMLLGTSFGGFGNKFFALLDLPRNDVAALRTELQELCPLPRRRIT